MNDISMVEAVYDLARVVIATNGKFETRAEAIRKLAEFSIPPSRIAAILAIKTNDVTSVLSKSKKKSQGAQSNGETSDDRI